MIDWLMAKARKTGWFTRAVFALFMLLPLDAAAQSVNAVPISTPAPIFNAGGSLAVNAPVQVCLITSLGSPCNTAGVILYSDSNLAQGINNPTKTNSSGVYSFFVNSSQYTLPQLLTIQVSVTPTSTYTYYFQIGSTGGTGVTWPTSGDLVLSNGTNSPAGLAPVNGDCPIGSGGAWTVGPCGFGTITGVVAGNGLSGGGTSGSVTVALTGPVSSTNGGTGGAGTGYAYGNGASPFTYSLTLPLASVVDLSSSTLPVCPNGAGNALTTVGCVSIAGSVSGQISGYIPLATCVNCIGAPSHMDDGQTTLNTITSTEPIAVTGPPWGITIPAGIAVPGVAGAVVLSSDPTNGYLEANEGNTGKSRVCTAANAVCATSNGFPIVIGSTSIASGSTTSTIAGLTLTSPTFTGPALGTPASGNLANTIGYNVLASSSVLGVIKGDGSTISISGAGVASCTTGTSSQLGCLEPDGSTITVAGGVISAAAASGVSILTIANAGTTGTTIHKLAQLTGSPSTAVIATASATGGVVGICTANCGTSGNATIQLIGAATCVFSNATTAGHYVTISSTTGDCNDAGATYPTGTQAVGRVLSTNASAGTYTIDIFPSEIQSNSGGVVASVAGDGLLDSNSPQTGAVALSVLTQTADMILAGPCTGSAADPTFRSLCASDFPVVNSAGNGYMIGPGALNMIITPAGAGTPAVTGTVYVEQFTMQKSMTLGHATINVSATPSAGGSCAVGYYSATGSKLIDSGPLSTTTANVAVSGSFSSVTLTEGTVYYYASACAWTGTTPTLAFINIGGAGVPAALNAVAVRYGSAANTYNGTSLPATLGTITGVNNGQLLLYGVLEY